MAVPQMFSEINDAYDISEKGELDIFEDEVARYLRLLPALAGRVTRRTLNGWLAHVPWLTIQIKDPPPKKTGVGFATPALRAV